MASEGEKKMGPGSDPLICTTAALDADRRRSRTEVIETATSGDAETDVGRCDRISKMRPLRMNG